MVMCRSEEALGKDIREKIALFANLPVRSVVSARNVDSIYKVPLEFEREEVAERVLDHSRMGTTPRTSPAGRASSTGSSPRRRRCASRLSASTTSSPMRTCR